jgi:hypothetical protein
MMPQSSPRCGLRARCPKVKPKLRTFMVFSTLLLLAACKSAPQNNSGSNSMNFKTPNTPITEGTVQYDCKKPGDRPTFHVTEQPTAVKNFTTNIQPTTRPCTPAKGKAADETCTQQVWIVTASYDVKSDLSSKVWQNKDVPLGEIVCDCICVKNSGGCDPSKINKDGAGAGVCRN